MVKYSIYSEKPIMSFLSIPVPKDKALLSTKSFIVIKMLLTKSHLLLSSTMPSMLSKKLKQKLMSILVLSQ